MVKSFLVAFAFAALSLIQDVTCHTYFKTYAGCNATFVCYSSPGTSVNWTNSLGYLSQGEKIKISTEPLYSVLTMNGLTTADQGNISCIRSQRDPLLFTLEVLSVQPCKDDSDTKTCEAGVTNGDNCSDPWMKQYCIKSCGLCPKTSCTEELQPTDPPTSTPEGTTTIPVESEGTNTIPVESSATSSTTNGHEAKDPSNSSVIFKSSYFTFFIMQVFLVWITLL